LSRAVATVARGAPDGRAHPRRGAVDGDRARGIDLAGPLRAPDAAFLVTERFRSADVAPIDDVQFLASRERTREEFFDAFNAVLAAGRQFVTDL
jgi:hypothetical protein